MADTWARKGAEINQVPWTKKSIVNEIDATAWLIQDRIMAVCTLFLEKHERPKDRLAKARYDPIVALELLGHIPSEHFRRDLSKCTICGISWHRRNSKKVASFGRCNRLATYACNQEDWFHATPCPIWRTLEDSRLVFNGSVVHQTHCIRWVRGVIFCNRCGHYSVAVMKGLPLPCKVKSIAGMEVKTM